MPHSDREYYEIGIECHPQDDRPEHYLLQALEGTGLSVTDFEVRNHDDCFCAWGLRESSDRDDIFVCECE